MNIPVILFAYKRPHELLQTVTALQANHLAAQTDLYVFVDGPRQPVDVTKVEAVRAMADQITGFRNIYRTYSPHNIGCANSVIAGIGSVLKNHPAAIILEDDIVTSPNFLDYMNQCLEQYADVREVFSVGGYTFPFPKPNGYTDDVYFFGRHCAWGWGIWADRWQQIDWDLTDFDSFINNPAARRAFNAGGADRVRMLERAKNKDIDAWDIRLCYAEYKAGGVTVFPTLSKTNNIGVDSIDSTTEVVYNRYKTPLDAGTQRVFQLPSDVQLNAAYSRRFRRKFSVPVRAWNKLRTYLTIRSSDRPAPVKG